MRGTNRVGWVRLPAMVGRPYEEERDLAAVTRMWREVGWIDDSDDQAAALRRFLGRGTPLLADVAGEAECMVHRTSGSMRYGTTDLPLCAITGVTTSHVGRRQGLASALMVETLGALPRALRSPRSGSSSRASTTGSGSAPAPTSTGSPSIRPRCWWSRSTDPRCASADPTCPSCTA